MELNIDSESQAIIGRVLLKTQKFEFLVHGIVAHFKPEVLQQTKLKGLTPQIFLATDENSRKLRRSTLGQIFEVLKLDQTRFLHSQELDELLSDRNRFIHHLWRDFFSYGSFKKYECLEFLLKLEMATDDWTKVFMGFLSYLQKAVLARQPIEEQQKFRDDIRHKINESYEPYFRNKFGIRDNT